MIPTLSLTNPWSSLLVARNPATGRPWKWVETRSAPPGGEMTPPGVRPFPGLKIARGTRIALHTSKKEARFEECPEGWRLLAGGRCQPGAITGSAIVVNAFPMTRWDDPSLEYDDFLDLVYGDPDTPWTPDQLTLFIDRCSDADLTDQLPYGHFTPGRWAWLLQDAAPTSERCPACWGVGGVPGSHADLSGQQLNDGGAEAAEVFRSFCTTCKGHKTTPPIPVRGALGLWAWNPEETP